MRSALDFTPYRQSWIGFENFFDMLESNRLSDVDAYPPFDLEQEDEMTYLIRLAVAGFGPEAIEITAEANRLQIVGRHQEVPERRYLYRGIAARNFERQFQLADYVVVTGARLNDGLLEIDLKRELPEAVKPRRIEISTPVGATPSVGQSKRKTRSDNNDRDKPSRPEAVEKPARLADTTKDKEPALSDA